MYKKSRDLDLKGKEVLIRTDYNVPLKDGEVADATRIDASLPTIKDCFDRGAAKVRLMNHLGKPQKELKKGKSEAEVREKLSMKPIGRELSKKLGMDVPTLDDCVDVELPDAKVVLLGNVRLDEREESKDEKARDEYAKKLAENGNVYINDAFGTCHREHASVYDITKHLPSAAGLLLEKELKNSEPFINPKGKSVAVIGGAKIEDKIAIVKSFLAPGKYQYVIVGGGMMFTFNAAMDLHIGKSLYNEDKLEECQSLVDNEEYNKRLLLSPDCVAAKVLDWEDFRYEDPKIVEGDIPSGYAGLDIGPIGIERAVKILADAEVIFANGPMGMFEVDEFSKGTYAVLEAIEANKKALKMAGGGDSVAAIKKKGYDIPVSTGGGAFLQLIQDGTLPCVEALKK